MSQDIFGAAHALQLDTLPPLHHIVVGTPQAQASATIDQRANVATIALQRLRANFPADYRATLLTRQDSVLESRVGRRLGYTVAERHSTSRLSFRLGEIVVKGDTATVAIEYFANMDLPRKREHRDAGTSLVTLVRTGDAWRVRDVRLIEVF